MKLQRPHDEFFKALLDQPGTAGALLRERLPAELVDTFAEGEPQLLPESFVLPELQEHQADRLFRVPRKEGSAAYVYCLIEHKSSPDSGIGLQLLRYLTDALVKVSSEAEHSGRLPIIAPVAELELRPPASAGAG